ncbi:MAG: fused MFS/spermidine synthase, partial [Pseudomonadota bacterium]
LALLPGLPGRLRLAPAVPLGIAAGVLLAPWPLRFVNAPDGGELVSYAEGTMASVAVVSDSHGVRYLKVNNAYTMGSSASQYSDYRQSHIPLLLHPAPESALYLGLGTGSTFSAAATHPGLTASAVELVPEVLPTLGEFGPSRAAYADNGRLTIHVSDARRYVSTSDAAYDVIIADVFHPSRDGAAALYTVEHFAAVRERLAGDGLFCQWLPLFQLDLPTLATIVRSFQTAFPETEAYLAHFSLGQPLIGLIGRREPAAYYRGWLRDRVDDPGLAEQLNALQLNSDYALFGNYLADAEALRRFAATAPLNTDNHPVVAYRAPGFVYGGHQPAATRLLALLDAVGPDAAALLVQDEAGAAFGERLGAYWQARDAYLRAGVAVTPSDDPAALLSQVAEPLLGVVAISNDFVPAYRPLLELAYDMYASDPDRSRALLDELVRVGPERTEARQLRRRLFGS